MKIAVFTSNQRRHLHLIRSLAEIADEIFAIQECTTVLPGLVPDALYGSSDAMRRYFSRMLEAEATVFGEFLPSQKNVKSLSLQMGDLSKFPIDMLSWALTADFFIVFGSSWIRGPLADALIERSALNIHMGISPEYRGSSCNFWALYDGNYNLVGGTIHKLSKGLDNGDIIFHARPDYRRDPFEFGMQAVQAAHSALSDHIKSGRLTALTSTPQDRAREIRYTKSSDFTDAIAIKYLESDICKIGLPQLP